MLKLCLKLYATGTTAADSVASAIVPINCSLVAASWHAAFVTSGTAGNNTLFQLSQQSTGQFATNDARNVIDEFIVAYSGGVTAINGGENFLSLISACDFKAGDKVYLHRGAVAAAFTSINLNVNLQFK